MGDSQSPSTENTTSVNAPTYDELLQLTYTLRDKLRALEEASRESTPTRIVQSRTQFDNSVLPDINRSVPIFTGRESNIAADDWIVSVTGVADLNSWDYKQCILFVRAHVAGAARSWFLSEQFVNWAEFGQKFREAFVQEIRISDRWNDLNHRNQRVDEHLVDYFYEKVRLCRVLNLPFDEIRDHVIQGLNSHELANFAMGRTHTTESNLLSDLRDWERMQLMRRDRFQAKNTSNPPAPGTPAKDTIGDKPRFYKSSDQSTITCYNYQGLGHILRDCPIPRIPVQCSNCGANQHTPGREGPLDAIPIVYTDVEMEDDNARSEATFRFEIENFSKFKDQRLSIPFYVRDLPWKILIRHRDNQNNPSVKPEQPSVGFFLQCNGDSENTSWNVNASASLRVISQKEGVANIERKIQNLFNSKVVDWGFSFYVSWEDITDEAKGFIKNDVVIFEVFVTADAPDGISKD